MSESNFSRKEIKTQRVRKVFVEITKKMILEQGIEAVSVRKVADEAGYTVATIYNHFEHADELLSVTRDVLINDLVLYLSKKTRKLTGAESIKNVFKNYIGYCLENPNVYHFLFSHHLKNVDKFTSSDAVEELFKQFTSSFKVLADNHEIDIETVAGMGNAILFAVHGMLTIHLSDNFALTKAQIYEGLDRVTRLILCEDNLKGENK